MADEKTESTETPDTPETKPKKKRILLKLFVVLILLLVLVVVFAPTIASSSAGKGYIESFANDAIPGSIQIDGLQLGWMSGQEITGLKVLDPDGQVVIAADSVSIGDLTLLAAAQGDLNIGKVKLTKPVINIERYDDGSTNLDKAFGLSQEKSNEPVSLPKDLAVDAELVDGQVTFKASGIDPVEMADIDATASLKPAGTAIELKLTTPVQQGSAKGDVDINATVNDLFDSNGQMQMAAMAVDGYVDLKKLPVDLADRLAGQDGRLTALLSEILNGRIEVKGNPESQLNSTLTFNSDRLKKGSLVLEITPKQITIKPDLQLEIIPQGWAKLTKDAAKLNQPFSVSVLPDEAIVIARNGNEIDIAKSVAKVRLAVGDIHLDAGGDVGKVDLVNTNGSVNFAGPDNIIKLSINANGKRGERTGAITITGDVQNPFDSDGKFNLAQTTATVIGEVDQVVLQVLDDILATKGEIASATGSDLQTVLKVQPSATESNEAFAGSAVFTAKAKNLTVDLSADIDADKIALKPNGKVTWKIEPQLLELVKKRMPDLSDDVKKLALQQPATLTVTTKATTIPAKDFSVEKVRFGVGVAIDRLAIKGDDRLAGIAVHTLNVDVPETTLADPVKFSGSTQLAIAKDQAGLEFGGTVTDALKKTLGYDVKTTLTNLPIDLAERFAASDGLLKKVLGKTLDEVTVAAKSGDAIALTATVKSKYLNANLPLDMAGNVFTFRDKPTIDLLLTPESFAALTASKDANAKAEYTLVNNSKFQVALANTVIALAEKPAVPVAALRATRVIVGQAKAEETRPLTLPLDPAKTRLDLKVTSDALQLRRESDGQMVKLDSVAIALNAKDLREQVKLTVDADLVEEGAKQKKEEKTIHMESTARALVNDAGEVDLSKLKVKTNSKVSAVPMALVVQLLELDKEYVGAIGPEATVTVDGTYPGDIDLLIKSENALIPMKVTITEDGHLRLREDCKAVVRLTPESSKLITGKINPLLSNVASLDTTVTVKVKKEGFDVPVNNFEMSKVNGNIDIDLGEMKVGNDGVVGQTTKLISQFSSSKSLSAKEFVAGKFTPMNVRMVNGAIETSDLWMTVSGFRFGVQGKFNPTTGDYNGLIGLSGQTLAKMGMDDIVDAKYVYELPLRGPAGETRPNFESFALQLAKVKAQAELFKAGGKNPFAKALLDRTVGNLFSAKPKMLWSHHPEPEPDQPSTDPAGEPVTKDPPKVEPKEPAKEPSIFDLINKAREDRKRKKEEKKRREQEDAAKNQE